MLMAIVFLLGAIVGASLGTTIVSRKFAAPHELAVRPGKAKFVDRLNARLHLSPQQTVQLKAILDETHQQFGALHESVKPQFEAGKAEVDKGRGIIRDAAVQDAVLADIQAFALAQLPGAALIGTMDSPITGTDGNREFLLGLRRG